MLDQLRELLGLKALVGERTNGFFIDGEHKRKSLQLRLYALLAAKPKADDEYLERELYGEGGNMNKSYLMLKRNLRNQMVHHIYALDPQKAYGSTFMVRYFQAQKGLFTARALISLGLYQTGVSIAKKTIDTAQEIELWDVVGSMGSLLSDFYSVRGDEKHFLYYDQLSEMGIRNFTSERELRRIVNRWNIFFTKVTTPGDEYLVQLESDLHRAEEILGNVRTAINSHLYYRLKLLYLEASTKYQESIEVCNEAIAFLKQKPSFNVATRIGIYYWTKMFCYLNLRDFSSASKFAQQGQQYFVKGTLNWFSVMEYFYVLSIQTENYKSAYATIVEVTQSQQYNSLPEAREQRWLVLEAYMELIIKGGIWKNHPADIPDEKFRVSGFINKVNVFRRDKTGVYVSILILQVLFLIHQGRYEEVIEKQDALSRYIRRYLYTKAHERSRVFLTLLERVISAEFSYSFTKVKTKRLVRVLQSKKMNYVANYGGNEIVDYELLWDWLLEKLLENPVTKLGPKELKTIRKHANKRRY